ncbi:MAG: hypothetical protein ACE5LU_04580 [Anaerolineae bacterium]
MTKISDLITIHSGYTQYVQLVPTFKDPTENRGRMEQYMPIKSHREAFTRLTRALYPLDNRVYLLTGSYGTGKSHLCLMLANYLTLKPGDPEMVAFFENWSRRDPEGAEKLRNLRGEGRYLVALGDYGRGDDFDSMVLRALQDAIEREELHEAWLDTHYQEAVRQIERWEERERRGGPSGTFSDFRAELVARYPDQTLDALKKDLSIFSQEALSNFREVYRAVVGREFSYSKDNLVDILQDFLSNPKFKTRYKGLVIITDEFGYILDRGNISIDVFQRFAEMCQNGVEGSQLVFVGTGHKPFRAYSAGGLSASDFSVAAARVTEVPLESEELELIISAIVVPNKEHPVWKSEVATQAGMFNRFALAASRIGIFKHLKGPELRERIVENIYPMHPMATHCLIEMSTEVGSNARSVFRFFSGAVETDPPPGSYRWYVTQTGVKTDNRLNLYTADELATYFAPDLRPDNTEVREGVRQQIRNYQASLREAQKQAQAQLAGELDPLIERVLKLLLIYEISKIAPTFDNLAFGLYCETPAEKSQLQNRLDALVRQKILFQSATGIYEFRRSEATDFESLIEQYKADPDNVPDNLADEVVNLVSLGRGGQWLEARNHNQPYDEDKRLLRVFAQPGDLQARYPLKDIGEEVDFFTHHERRLQSETTWKSRYEGVVVYVLCETEEDIARARRAAEANQSDRVIVGVPRQPIPVREAAMNLRAARHIQKTEDLDVMTLQDRSRLQEEIIGDERRETGFAGDFVKARRRYLEAKELSWYGKGGTVLVAKPQSEYEPADESMGRLFEKRNKWPHPYLNQIHVSRFGPGKDVPLTDAVNALLRTHRPVEIDHSAAANRGEIRYLKNVLADSGALRQVGPASGNIAWYDVERSPDKFRPKLPALAAMLDTLSGLKQGETPPVRKLLADHADVPYGQGPIALSLFLAYAIRAFGDELRLQLQPGAVGYVAMNDPDLIIGLVNNAHPNAILERQTISPAARNLINGIYNLFAAEPGVAGQQHAVNEAYAALRDWWGRRPNLAKVPDIYEDDSSTQALVKLLRNVEGANPYRLVLEQLQTAYGFPEDAMITPSSQGTILEGLRQDKTAIEGGAGRVQNALLKRLMAPFNPQSDFYGDYQAAIERWYKDLGEEQQDDYAPWHSHASRAVVQRLRTIVNIEDTFFEQLPADAGFGLGKVAEWHRDRSDEYVQMLEAALERIEANRIKIPVPDWKVRGVYRKEELQTQSQILFRGGVVLGIRVPEPGIKVLVTDTGEDPRTAQQRQEVKDEFDLSVKKSCAVKLVSQGRDGSFGRVVTISFVNEDRKYEIAPLTQQQLLEREFKFVYPEDKAALQVLLSSILRYVIKHGLVNEEEARQLLTDLADKLEELY